MSVQTNGTLSWIRSEWERVAAGSCLGLGLLALFLGYRGISESPYVAEQLAFLISGGIGGLFLLGVGATLFVSADLHDEWTKLDQLEMTLRELAAGEAHRIDRDAHPEPLGGEPSDDNGTHLSQANRLLQMSESMSSTISRTANFLSGDGDSFERRTHELRAPSAVIPIDARSMQNRAAGFAAMAAATLVLIWFDASREVDIAPVIDSVSKASVVLFFLGIGAACYLAVLRRTVARRAVRVVGAVFSSVKVGQAAVTNQISLVGRARRAERVQLGEGCTYFHASDCCMLSSIDNVQWMSRESALKLAKQCGLCLGSGDSHG